jgi:hypothetical protein
VHSSCFDGPLVGHSVRIKPTTSHQCTVPGVQAGSLGTASDKPGVE